MNIAYCLHMPHVAAACACAELAAKASMISVGIADEGAILRQFGPGSEGPPQGAATRE